MGETNSIKTNYLREKGVQVPFAPRTTALLVLDLSRNLNLDTTLNKIFLELSTLTTILDVLNEKCDNVSSTKEDKSNKVTSITSGSTDTQYPSAKAVYTEVDKKADKSTVDSLENKVNTKTTFHSGAFNAGNITEEGWYDEITSGRPSGSDDVGGTETYILYMSSSGSQICFSKKYSGKAYSRITKNDAWKRLDNSNVRDSGYGADNITEEGWYDNVNLTRPEGSESDEKYYLYHSANGGQICFSRRNSGKAYQRLGIGHQWVPLTHDDYSIENPLAALYKSCTLINTYENSSISYHTSNGYGYDSLTNLTEYYAGDNNETTNFHISVGLNELKPNDVVRVRCVYRRGFSAEGVNTYPYDSDAYMFVSKSIDSTNHSIANNESNWIKIKSMGSQNFPFTDGEKGWQDLAFMRDRFFDENYEYSWHYIRVTASQIGEDSGSTPGNYLHIYGDFTKPGSWFVFDKAEVYRASNNIYYSNIDLSQIPEGTLSGDVVTQLNKLRNDVLNANTKIVAFGFENADVESKSIYASISNNSNTFGVMISLDGSAMGLEYNYSSETWESTLVTFEQISNKVTSITSGSTDTQYPSAKAVYTNVSAKYTKPSTGIPKTDLASAIQTSLGKADTAVQPSDITSKENTSNKVTSISSGSTDTQYASAKAVYTEIDKLKDNYELVQFSDGPQFPLTASSSTTYAWTLLNEDTYLYYDIEAGGKLFGFIQCYLNGVNYNIDIRATNSSTQIYLEYVNLPEAFIYCLSNPYISRPSTTGGHGEFNLLTGTMGSGNSLIIKKVCLYRIPKTFENTSNKVTSLSSSSTDVQYPSAKTVYDGINGLANFTDYNNIPLIKRSNNPEAIAQATLNNWQTDDVSSPIVGSEYMFDDVHEKQVQTVVVDLHTTGTKIYQQLNSPVDVRNKCVRFMLRVDPSETITNIYSINVILATGSLDSSHRAIRNIWLPGMNLYGETPDKNWNGWICGCISPIPTINDTVDKTGQNFDPSNVNYIGFHVAKKTTDSTKIYIAQLDVVQGLSKPGACIVVDNFNEYVPAMADYAASKGVKLNLSIIPNWIGTQQGGYNHATLAQINRNKRQGHFIFNHTWNHVTTPETYAQIREGISLSDNWMVRHGFARGSKILSVPSSLFDTNRYKAYVQSECEMIYHHWLPYPYGENYATPHYLITYPYYPADRFLTISGLDFGTQTAAKMQYFVNLAQAAVDNKGIAVIGFHGRGTSTSEASDVWKGFIDGVAQIQGITFYGIDELLEGTFY